MEQAADRRGRLGPLNAFQVQPGEQNQWDSDLLLRDAAGNLVIDENWGEPLLDLRTEDKRTRIASKVNGWIDGCKASGDPGYVRKTC